MEAIRQQLALSAWESRNGKTIIMDFNFLRKKIPLPGLCCLYLLPDKLIVAHALNPTTVSFIEVSIYQLHSLKLILTSIIEKHGLQRAKCTWVLHPAHYQLLLLDRPSVEPAEIALALRWQMKELVHLPLQEAAIEYFTVPSSVSSKEKLYVAVAPLSALQTIKNIITDAGFDLQCIDIPELALTNISALYDNNQCYLALLSVNQSEIELFITREKNLLLSRKLALPSTLSMDDLKNLPQAGTPPPWFSALITDIQHSLTFAQSHHQQELPVKLLVSTPISTLPAYFGQLLGVEAEQLFIEKKLNLEFVLQPDDYLSLDYLIALGGARQDSQHHAYKINFLSRLSKPSLYAMTAQRACYFLMGWIALLIAISIIQCLYVTLQKCRLSYLEHQEKSTTSQFQALIQSSPKLQEITKLNSAIRMYSERMQMLSMNYPRITFSPSSCLKALANRATPGMWLTQIHLQHQGQQISLQGLTLSASQLMKFSAWLQTEKTFGSKPFNRVSTDSKENQTLAFTLTTQDQTS